MSSSFMAGNLTLLPELLHAYAVDRAIMDEKERLVIVRFGRNHAPETLAIDGVCYKIAPKVVRLAVIYAVDVAKVPEFNGMYELYDDWCLMIFFRKRHIMVDIGSGNNNKINGKVPSKNVLIQVVETVFEGAEKGKGLVDVSTALGFSWSRWDTMA